MKKTFKIIITNEAYVDVDVESDITDEELLDKVEEELKKGYASDMVYFEIDSEVDKDE